MTPINRWISRATPLLAAALGLLLAGAAPHEGDAAEVTVDAPPAAAVPTVDELTRHLDALYRADSSHGTMRMEVVTRRYARTMEIEAWTRGKDEALMVIRAPAREAGNASLKTADGLWSYGKRSDRLLRVPPGLLGESWMGSHFTNDDLMRESSYEDDYDATIEAVEEDGARLLRLRLVPRPDTAIVYTKLEYFVTADGWLPVRLDFYDKDTVARRMHFEDVKDLGGRRLPTRLRLVPTDAPDERTVVTYLEMAFDQKVDSRVFTPQGLRRATER